MEHVRSLRVCLEREQIIGARHIDQRTDPSSDSNSRECLQTVPSIAEILPWFDEGQHQSAAATAREGRQHRIPNIQQMHADHIIAGCPWRQNHKDIQGKVGSDEPIHTTHHRQKQSLAPTVQAHGMNSHYAFKMDIRLSSFGDSFRNTDIVQNRNRFSLILREWECPFL